MLLAYDSGDFADNGDLDAAAVAARASSRVTATSDFSGVASPPPGYWLGSHAEASHLKLRQTLADHLFWSRADSMSSPAPRSNNAGQDGLATPTTAPRR